MTQPVRTGLYYQAIIPAERCWMATAIIRASDHMCFDRTVDKEQNIFEFFVPECNKERFEQTIARLEKLGVIHSLKQLPNRFANPEHSLHLEA